MRDHSNDRSGEGVAIVSWSIRTGGAPPALTEFATTDCWPDMNVSGNRKARSKSHSSIQDDDWPELCDRIQGECGDATVMSPRLLATIVWLLVEAIAVDNLVDGY